ncbi:MAG: tetratricopeptide repeat protein [Candidatus Latescibacteria bacterium]|nr:tetratricopeptide repeat protein [Candidatus Latescibacterota bacterium]
MLPFAGRIALLWALLIACSQTPEARVSPAQRQQGLTLARQGGLLLQQGRPAQALHSLTAAVALIPDQAEAHYNLGLAHTRLDQHDRAATAFARACQLKPEQATYHFAWGTSLRAQHRYLEAAERYQRALDLDPDQAQYHFRLAETRRATSDFAGAIAALDAAVQLDSTLLPALSMRADLLARSDQLESAEKTFRQILAQVPNHLEALQGLAALQTRQQRYDRASALLQRALLLEPRNQQTYYLLNQAYSGADQTDQARQALNTFDRLTRSQRHFDQGQIYARRQDWSQAAAAVQQAIAADSTFLQAHLLLGLVQINGGQPYLSLATGAQALALAPEDPEVHCLLGEAHLASQQWPLAAQAFNQALRFDPYSHRALFGLARSHLAQRQPEAAVPILRRLLDLLPDHREGHYLLGLAHLETGRPETARHNLNRAIAIDSTYVEAHYGLGLALQQIGQAEAARQTFAQVLQLRPEHSRARQRLAAGDK